MIGRRVHKQAKSQDIYGLICKSIAPPMADDSPAIATFRLQLGRYLQLCKVRQALEAQADVLLSCRSEYQLLRSLPDVAQ
ncbi:MAG: hypothetical protein AB7F79_13160 [Steroidobacteraceae bacterium]